MSPNSIEPSSGGSARSSEQDETSLRTEGQRRINIIWELTQSAVAILVTAATLFIAGRLALVEGDRGAFLLLSNVFFLVLGTYFQRTNHVKTGGVGKDSTTR